MRKIFAVIGKSCAGKDTLLKEIQKETSNLSNLPIIISYTTRPARQGEVDGKDYKFISDEKFLNMAINKKFADFSSYSVVQDFIWYYGLSKEDLEKHPYAILITNPKTLKTLQKQYGDKIVAINLETTPEQRILRYLKRQPNMSEMEIAECCRRFVSDIEDFKNITTNYTLDSSVDSTKLSIDLENIILKEIIDGSKINEI